MEVNGSLQVKVALPLGKKPGAHCTGGWVPVWTFWRSEKSLTHTGNRNSDRPNVGKGKGKCQISHLFQGHHLCSCILSVTHSLSNVAE
jgi:hypothetical protein